jgi:hypothetical protein
MFRPGLPISKAQLRRLQALWQRWTASLQLAPESDRRLRHYYVELFSGGRASETKQLTRADAGRVIAQLERLAGPSRAALNRAAGTAGRRGFPQWRRIRANSAAWRALWGVAAALGMNDRRLDEFIRRHYARLGLYGLRDLQTMADLNRVLWGLKAMLRRRAGAKRRPSHDEKKAA